VWQRPRHTGPALPLTIASPDGPPPIQAYQGEETGRYPEDLQRCRLQQDLILPDFCLWTVIVLSGLIIIHRIPFPQVFVKIVMTEGFFSLIAGFIVSG